MEVLLKFSRGHDRTFWLICPFSCHVLRPQAQRHSQSSPWDMRDTEKMVSLLESGCLGSFRDHFHENIGHFLLMFHKKS